MKESTGTRSLLGVVLVLIALASFPGAAAANLFVEEGTETIPAETVDTGEPVVTADELPVAVTGERLEVLGNQGQLEILAMGSDSVSCDIAEVDGGSLPEPVTELSLAVEYTDCSVEISGEEHPGIWVSTNSCEYMLSDIAPDLTAATEISCDEGDEIEIDLWGCIISIPPQSLGTETEYANMAPQGEKQLGLGIVGLNMTYSISNIICSLAGMQGPGAYEDGALDLEIALRGT